jgi:hypothetical protein
LPRVIDEHAPHRLGGEREEMLPVVDDVGPVHQTEIRLVDQGRGLQGVLPGLAPHVASGN